MVRHKVLCVAEKNDAAKNIASILSNGQSQFRNGQATYNKLYCYDGVVQNQQSSIVFTSVSGHLKNLEFPSNLKNWSQVPIRLCFTAPINSVVNSDMKQVEQQLM
jgi:DNA topoisomerase-3